MARVVKIMGGEGGFFYSDYKVDATTVAGVLGIRSAVTNSAGEVVDATTTAALDALGIYSEAVTYTATPTGPLGATPEGIVRIITHPFAVIEWEIAGTAAGAALATASPANRLVEESGDTTNDTVTDDAVGTISMAGGLIKGRTGANAGQLRRISVHTNNVSTEVEVDFVNDIAVGDSFIRVPQSKAGIAAQLTTDLTEVDGVIATGTGIPMMIYDVVIDESRDIAWLYGVLRTHYYNSLA